MAPHKRKAADDDFFYTLSDDEKAIATETNAPRKKRTKKDDSEVTWGGTEEDDGALDPNFEFEDDGGPAFEEEESAVQDLVWVSDKKHVDLDDMIRRKRNKKKAQTAAPVSDIGEDEVDGKLASDLDLDDDEDGVLAPDGFGMGVASDVEELVRPCQQTESIQVHPFRG